MASQEVLVQYHDGNTFQTTATIRNTGSVPSSTVSFSEVTTSRLRFYQNTNMGYAQYPSVMWVTEVDYGMGSCSPVHAADNTPCDGTIRMAELSAYISLWKQGTAVSLASLMEAIRIWKG
jgi:hypothetical protein